MDHVASLTCTRCGETYDPAEFRYTCDEHEGFEGILEVEYDYDRVLDRFDAPLDGAIPDQWKYRAFLPVSDDADPVTLGEGGTALLEAPRLSEALGVTTYVKDDGRNPTGVLKDRASAVSMTKARELGRETVTCASTGNAAASLGGYAARGGFDCRIFVPGSAPEGKLAQPLVYGADVLAVEGSYEQATALSLEVTDAYGWYNRNAAINPFQVEGKRTVGLEVAEQAHARGLSPDWFVFSVGDGCTIFGGWKGVKELRDLGLVDDAPRMLGVQAEGAPHVHEVFNGEQDPSEAAETLADSIAVGKPANLVKAVKALRESDGESVLVSDEAILEAETLLGRTEGVYAEPAAAAPVAGVAKAREQGIIGAEETVVVCVTGTGLKDTKSAQQAAGTPTSIPPTLEAVADRYGGAAD
ncbi:MAG: threonine synthase [Halobacteriales archaeon]